LSTPARSTGEAEVYIYSFSTLAPMDVRGGDPKITGI